MYVKNNEVKNVKRITRAEGITDIAKQPEITLKMNPEAIQVASIIGIFFNQNVYRMFSIR